MPLGIGFDPRQMSLKERETSVERSAVLRVAMTEDADTWASDWAPTLNKHKRYDASFPWRQEIDLATSSEGRLALALASEKGLEGMVSLSVFRAGSQLEAGKDILYVEYVGIAPPHQLPPVGERVVGGIGTIFASVAMELSDQLGFDCRVGLHSKVESEGFYRRLGFADLGLQPTEDGTWRYFEITPEKAKLVLA